MAILTLDLFESLAITQGYQWMLTIRLPGDQRGSQIQLRIYNRYGGLSLHSSNTTQGEFVADLNKTLYRLRISQQQTADLPLTGGSSYYVYNVAHIRFGAPPLLLLAGKVKINPSLS